jgi:hypothetical protein
MHCLLLVVLLLALQPCLHAAGSASLGAAVHCYCCAGIPSPRLRKAQQHTAFIQPLRAQHQQQTFRCGQWRVDCTSQGMDTCLQVSQQWTEAMHNQGACPSCQHMCASSLHAVPGSGPMDNG